MTQETTPKKKRISGGEKILFLLAVAVLLLVVFRKGNNPLFERSDEAYVLDKPHQSEGVKKIKTYSTEEEDPRVNAVLVSIAERFSSNEPIGEEAAEWGLSSDEKAYYDKVKAEHELDDAVRNIKDWYHILKASSETYARVKSLFSQLDRRAVEKNQLDRIMNNQKDAQEVYRKMQEWFGISPSEAQAFARSGKKALSDWAKFVEEQEKVHPRQ